MTTNIDIKLIENAEKIYDIDFQDNGDFILEDSFDTSIILSLGTDARADESQITIPEKRRGWWGNIFNSDITFENGSLLWLLEQARRTQLTLNSAIDFASKSLNWFITDNYVKAINVSSNLIENGIKLNISFIRNDDRVENFSYQLWEGSEYK